MPRPRKCRLVGQSPRQTFYKPQGVPMQELVGINLPVEGLEALRLADAQGLEHEMAAKMMGISRPTFSRILNEARHTVALALSKGWALSIDGGDFEIIPSTDNVLRGSGRRKGNCKARMESRNQELIKRS